MSENNKNFQFYLPVEIEKGQNEGEWKVKGLASTEDIDAQNEVIVQKGLDISHLESGLGLFNYDHLRGPENVVGQITTATQKSEGLFVEGYLFKEQPKAQAIHNIMKSLDKSNNRRLKMSIEGKVLKRKGNKILKAKVMNVALTLNPINGNTYAEFAKSFAAANDMTEDTKVSMSAGEESVLSSSDTDSSLSSNMEKGFIDLELRLEKIENIIKSLATGNYNAAPSTLTQGAALSQESLDKKKKKIKDLAEKVSKSYPHLTSKEAAKVAFVAYQKINKE